MTWYFSTLPFLCLTAAVIELDDVRVGQWLISRPFVVGPLMGWLLGDPWLGTKIGILLELLTIDDLPVGNAIPLNATVATAASVIFSAGPASIAPAVSLPAGLLAGALFRHVENWMRSRSRALTLQVEAAIADCRPTPFADIMRRSLLRHIGAAGSFLYLATAALSAPLAWACGRLPDPFQYGFNAAWELSPWLGFATLARMLRKAR